MNLGKFIKENSRGLLTLASSLGVVATAVCAGRDTLKADKVIQTVEAPTFKEKAKATWKCYIPTAVSGTLTIGSIVLNSRLTAKEIAALTAAVGSGGYLLNEYKSAIKENFGKEGYDKVVRTVAKHHEDGIPYAAVAHIDTIGSFYSTRDIIPAGDTLFYDEFSDTWFRSSTEAIRLAFYHFNRMYTLSGAVSIMELYSFLGIEEVVSKKKGPGWYDNFGYGWSYREDEMYWIDYELVESCKTDTKENYYIISYAFAPLDLTEEDEAYPIPDGYIDQGCSEVYDGTEIVKEGVVG